MFLAILKFYDVESNHYFKNYMCNTCYLNGFKIVFLREWRHECVIEGQDSFEMPKHLVINILLTCKECNLITIIFDNNFVFKSTNFHCSSSFVFINKIIFSISDIYILFENIKFVNSIFFPIDNIDVIVFNVNTSVVNCSMTCIPF